MTEEKFEWRVRLCQTELTFLNSVLDELLQDTQAEKHEVSYERRRNQNKNYPLYKKANDAWYDLHWKQSGLKNMIRRFSGILEGKKPKTKHDSLIHMNQFLNHQDEEKKQD